MNKKTLLIAGAAAAALLAFRGRARAAVDGPTTEVDNDRLIDSAPATTRAPARPTGTGGQGKSVLTKAQEGTAAIAHGASTAIGAGVAALGKLLA